MKRIQIYDADWQRWDELTEQLNCQNESQADVFHCFLEWVESQLQMAVSGTEQGCTDENGIVLTGETSSVVSQLISAMASLTSQFQQHQQQQLQITETLAQLLQAATTRGSLGQRTAHQKSMGLSKKESSAHTAFEQLSSEELKKSHAKGSAEEKLRRAYQAILTHNEQPQRLMAEKWAINQNALAELTGCNRPAIKAFLKQHRAEIEAHHQKHNLLPRHNYAHGKVGIKVTDVITW